MSSQGACCNGGSGFCGFGSDFCGASVCTSNCDAKAECGKNAPPQNVTCPLNVCCSQFGFCGTTTDFCGDGCQSGCDAPPIPSCGTNQETALTRRIGYYEAWAATRGCMAYTPEKISAETLTHINFAFALISSSFKVVEMTPGDSDLWKRTTALKKRNPTLKVFLSIGGWTFDDPPTSQKFSNMVGSTANTNTFISSCSKPMDSIDRGGAPADTKNYVTFMGAVKKAFSGPGYGLTFTAPSSHWYLQHFDLPGLLEHADWVNVMTYDLHGTWDGVDIFIGPIVGAHTNLTEIDEAFKLYWRVGVDPNQMVMGLGFYGRSFTLASADCSSPGCIWASGANAGPCSGQSGILMYAEIQSILNQVDGSGSKPSPVFDEDAAVKYVVWDTYYFLSSRPRVQCLLVRKMGATPEDPLSPGKRCDRLICCPTSNSPSSCNWRGGDTSPYNPTCQPGEQSLTTQTCESGGSQAFYCTSDLKLSDYCTYYDCTDPDSATCPQSPPQTLFTTVVKGELDLDTIDFCQDVRKNCHDNACPLGQVLLTTDIQGDASKHCSGSATRSFCCDFNGHDEEPVPFSDIFPDTVPEGSFSFQEEFDPDEGVKEGSTGSGTSSPLPNDQEENDTAFGEVFIDSPNAGSVSSLDLQTNWVITSCHPTSDQPQSVAIYCSKVLSSSECSHVMIGGAENTIVKMPQNCGRGPYARIASLAPHPNQDILSSFRQSKKPADEPVYLLKFDYNFAVIPEANGPIYMRADVTDMPDYSIYWDTVVESPPERKRWLKERGLEKRWWGSFKSWLSKMTQVEKDTSVSRNFRWSDTWTIFHKEAHWVSKGPSQFEASIDVSLTGQASLNTHYGFYLQATVVPPAELLLEKRGSIPFLPGFLNCPDVDDHIGADGTDNDPYSDVNLNTLDDAMERRSLENDLDDFGNDYSPDDPSNARSLCVKVSECPKISFNALAYNNLGRLYFDLQNPTVANFDPTFSTHGSPAPGAKSTTYGREHIYEMQLISDFMSSLATQTALWQPVNKDFCTWLTQNVVNQGYESVYAVAGKRRQWIKANTIHGNALTSSNSWKKYTFTKMLSVMRSTAGLSSYMNDPETGVQVTGGITGIYTNFIRGVMNQFSDRLSAGPDTMITFWDNAVQKLDSMKPSPKVAIDFGIAISTGAATPTLDVVGLDLSPLQNFILNHGVTWWSRL
ncbi:hypothetical protein DFH09DRAFT_1447553 [Mycena vulgaris]|nr:hypothetical protein DFH09DRAFT_1447553 [Mycena vulgaris]